MGEEEEEDGGGTSKRVGEGNVPRASSTIWQMARTGSGIVFDGPVCVANSGTWPQRWSLGLWVSLVTAVGLGYSQDWVHSPEKEGGWGREGPRTERGASCGRAQEEGSKVSMTNSGYTPAAEGADMSLG